MMALQYRAAYQNCGSCGLRYSNGGPLVMEDFGCWAQALHSLFWKPRIGSPMYNLVAVESERGRFVATDIPSPNTVTSSTQRLSSARSLYLQLIFTASPFNSRLPDGSRIHVGPDCDPTHEAGCYPRCMAVTPLRQYSASNILPRSFGRSQDLHECEIRREGDC
eukprot:202542-Prorocentrum_minimum.AAC.1